MNLFTDCRNWTDRPPSSALIAKNRKDFLSVATKALIKNNKYNIPYVVVKELNISESVLFDEILKENFKKKIQVSTRDVEVMECCQPYKQAVPLVNMPSHVIVCIIRN